MNIGFTIIMKYSMLSDTLGVSNYTRARGCVQRRTTLCMHFALLLHRRMRAPTCVLVCMRVHAIVCMCLYVCIRACVYACMNACVCVYAYAYIYVRVSLSKAPVAAHTRPRTQQHHKHTPNTQITCIYITDMYNARARTQNTTRVDTRRTPHITHAHAHAHAQTHADTPRKRTHKHANAHPHAHTPTNAERVRRRLSKIDLGCTVRNVRSYMFGGSGVV